MPNSRAELAKSEREAKPLDERQVLALEQIAEQSGLIQMQLQAMNRYLAALARDTNPGSFNR